MKVIPVLDILGGKAVHAVGGDRSAYFPLQTPFCESSCPLQISSSIQKTFGLSEWYIADLDGIIYGKRNCQLMSQLASGLTQVRYDWGIRVIEDLMCDELNMNCARTILGSETLFDGSVLEAVTAMYDPSRFCFSLDLFEGKPISNSDAWAGRSWLEIAEIAISRGITELLLLDLASVGRGFGLQTLNQCEELKKRFPEVCLLTGGGVRGEDDLLEAKDAGVDGVLIGTVLHTSESDLDWISNYA